MILLSVNLVQVIKSVLSGKARQSENGVMDALRGRLRTSNTIAWSMRRIFVSMCVVVNV